MMRIAVDTGGTFTDVVRVDGGRRHGLKIPSTPDDPSRAVLAGIREILAAAGGGGPAGDELPAGAAVVHGSTVATNALLEGRGAPVAFVTTAGFEDLLEIGRQARPDLYDAAVRPPAPLAPRERCIGARERLDPDGAERVPLDEEALDRSVREMVARGIERFAVCFLHAYADPAHEQAAARIITEAGGQATLSSRILPEYREFERASTTVVNAALAPVMSSYLERLEAGLGAARLSVFRSNGGALSARAAADEAVNTLLSGPAAGVVGAVSWGARAGLERLITFDMGGTSTDVALCAGAPTVTTEAVVAGHPVGVPLIDIHTIGAGGGSLARVGAGGALVVGPQSAGADPGPACYGRGTLPTVTDAQVVLGRIPASSRLGERLAVDAERARQAVGDLAGRLGIALEEAAAGIVQVANAAMERALRVVSLARGHDPRDFALFCFGGAGGLHAAELARALGLAEVIVPPEAGVFSAVGMLDADVILDRSAAVLQPLSATGPGRRSALAGSLEDELRAALRGEGFPAQEVEISRTLDLRYAGQSFEINVPDGDDPEAAFHREHHRRHGYRRENVPVELVTLRVRGIGRVAPVPFVLREERADASPSPRASLPVWTGDGTRPAGIFRRGDLEPGARFDGPAVVGESGATTYLPPGWRARVDGAGNLRLAPREKSP